MKKVYQLEKGQVGLSLSHLHTDDGLLKRLLFKTFILIIIITLSRANYNSYIKYLEFGGSERLITMLFFTVIVVFLITVLLFLFFKRDWRKDVKLTAIEKILVTTNKTNEVEIKLFFDNNKRKLFTFRKLEKEYERFLNDIKKTSNCSIFYK